MHKLNIYLNPDQYEKLQILTGETDEEKLEEFLNNAVYDGIASAWLEHKGSTIKEYLESDAFEDETALLSLGGRDYEIWSDGEQAVISEDDETITVQLIGGHLHIVLLNGTRIRCEDETHERLSKALETANVTVP